MLRYIIPFVSFLLVTVSSFSQTGTDSVLRSIGYYQAIEKETADINDSIIVKKTIHQVDQLRYTDPYLGEFFAKKSYLLAEKINYKKGIAQSLRMIGNMKMRGNGLDSALFYIEKSLSFSQKNGLDEEIYEAYYSMGSEAFYQGNYDRALSYYFKADELANQKFPKRKAETKNGIGLVFRVIENNKKSKTYFQEAYRLSKLYKDTANIIQALNNLGIIAKNEDEHQTAFDYYFEGLELGKRSGNLRRLGEIYYNLSVLYFKIKDKENGLLYMEKAAAVTQKIGNDRGRSLDYYSLGDYYYKSGDYYNAKKNLKKAEQYGKKAAYTELLVEAYNALGEVNSALGSYKEAYTYQSKAYLYKDSLNLQDANATALEMESKIEMEKMAVQDSLERVQLKLEKEHQKRLNQEKLKSRDTLLWAAAAIIMAIAIALFFVFRSRKKIQQKNAIITNRNEKIVKQKEEIEEQHKEIKDSINYAKRIQTALIAGNEEWDKISLEHFILFQPKDVVSGDFYWAFHNESAKLSIWVTADCTGHGVPGAFMSMLGIGFLNEIIIENDITKGSDILNKLRTKIIKALEQKGSSSQQKDGMDMTLCIWDHKNNTLEYTGANNPLWIIRKNENISTNHGADRILENKDLALSLMEFKPNKMPVGFYSGEQKPFESRSIQLKKEDLIVTFSDGFADQFGGEKGKKMKYKPFKELLLSIQNKPVKLQGEILLNEFVKWKGDYEQIDDVCVIGVRV